MREPTSSESTSRASGPIETETKVARLPAGGDGSRPRAGTRLEGALAALLTALAVIVLVLVSSAGKAGRRSAAAAEGPVVARTSGDLLDALEATGARGAVLVSFSRFLHFVPIEGAVPREAATFPVQAFDLEAAYRAQASPKNMLWLALESGVTREVVHVLPPGDYRERRASLSRGEAGIWLEPERIVTHEVGARRTIVDRVPEDRLRGPLLIVVDASYLDGVEAEDLPKALSAVDLELGQVIFSRAEDNEDVSAPARLRLDELVRDIMRGRAG